MIRLRGVLVLLLVLFALGSVSLGQTAKDEPAKFKGVLPQNWGKLGLSDEQKQKVYKVQNDYDQKIATLEKQLKDLKSQEKVEMEKVLTDAQKARLREILLGKVPAEDKKDK
ncbi:MAG: hypothetical protein JNM56_08690 [Planctomycetia bacterium]|nr:hypothetical protein [Planctomycetia bacterium]